MEYIFLILRLNRTLNETLDLRNYIYYGIDIINLISKLILKRLL